MQGVKQGSHRLYSLLLLLQAHDEPITLLHLFQHIAFLHLALQFCRLNTHLSKAVACHDLTPHIHRLHRRNPHRVAILEEGEVVLQAQRRAKLFVQRLQQLAGVGIADIGQSDVHQRVQRMVAQRRGTHLREVVGERLLLHLLGFLHLESGFPQFGVVSAGERKAGVEG